MKKILIIFGTRPEAIKMAPLVKELKKYPNCFDTEICVTAQHREMLDQVLKLFEIIPNYDLNIMKQEQDLFSITVDILLGIKNVLQTSKPDLVFVHGDTTTSFVAALACFYEKIKVAHIEAGLRTYDIYSPWPEEANRQLTSKIVDYHFTPTSSSSNNLYNENISKEKILITGNTVIDALHVVLEKIQNDISLENVLKKDFFDKGYTFSADRKIVLVTGHRRENFGQGFIDICYALKILALNNPNIDIIYPVHLNPNVQKPVKEILSGISNIFLMKPLEYLPFVYLMAHSYIIVTDSGGIQEEAPSLGKPVLVMRNTTERPEAIHAGTVKLVGTDRQTIVQEIQKILNDTDEYNKMSKAHNPYGDGKACMKIVKFLLEQF